MWWHASRHRSETKRRGTNRFGYRAVSSMNKAIVIAGSLAQKPAQGGHTWVLLQYLLGLRRLGWTVTFLDRLDPEMCSDDDGQRCDAAQSRQARYCRDVLEGYGLGDAY